MAGRTTYLGIGFYTYPEAARIVGVSPTKLRRWIKDFYYSSHGDRYHHTPIISRYVHPDERVLTFLELIELLFIKLFRQEGLSMQAIRLAARRGAELFSTDYPFAARRFSTDGKHIFATLSREADSPALMEELSRGQLVFPEIVQPFPRKIEDRGEAGALMFWPRERDGRVVLDPERRFGKPIDEETGVPTAILFNATRAGGGYSVQAVARWYEVPVAAVEAAVAFESSLLAA